MFVAAWRMENGCLWEEDLIKSDPSGSSSFHQSLHLRVNHWNGSVMSRFLKKVLRRLKRPFGMSENGHHIINEGEMKRENSFVIVINCRRFHPDKMEYLKAAIRRLTDPRVDLTIKNKGEIVMSEQLIIIDKTEIPNFTAKEGQLRALGRTAKSNTKLTFTNKGRLEVSTKVYFVVNNYRDFMATGVLRQLMEEGIGTTPIPIAKNTGRITKSAEIVHGLSTEEATTFEQRCIPRREATEEQLSMMAQFDISLEDARCFDLTLSSIPHCPEPTE